MSRSLVALTLALIAFSSTAASEGEVAQRTVVVVPFSAVGVSLGEAARLTEAAVQGAGRAGFAAEQARVAMSDLLAIHGCAASDDECLATIPATLGVDIVIFGSARIEKGSASLVVIVLESGQDKVRKEIPLEGITADERATRSGEVVFTTLGGTPELVGPAVDDVGSSPATDDLATPTVTHGTGGFDTGQVDRLSWTIGAVGLGSIAAGGLLLFIGENRQSAINDAATETQQDLEDLEGLETQARFLFGAGNVMVVGGLVATAVGGALIFHQARPRPEGGARVTVAPSVTSSGAGIVVRVVGWR